MVGSLHNQLYGRMTKGAPIPEVGMGATILMYTDRDAATIVSVGLGPAKNIIGVQRDQARRTDSNGMSEMQEYEYERDTSAPVNYFRLREGRWESVRWNPLTKRWNKCGSGGGLLVGRREHYYDFSF